MTKYSAVLQQTVSCSGHSCLRLSLTLPLSRNVALFNSISVQWTSPNLTQQLIMDAFQFRLEQNSIEGCRPSVSNQCWDVMNFLLLLAKSEK